MRAPALAQLVQAPGLRVGARPPSAASARRWSSSELARGEARLQRLAAAPQRADVGGERIVAVAIVHQRGEQRFWRWALSTAWWARSRSSKWPMRAWMRGPTSKVEHVVAHEVGEVADRLHRHGLVEELERLLVVDAEAAAEPGGVGREAVEHPAPAPRRRLRSW